MVFGSPPLASKRDRKVAAQFAATSLPPQSPTMVAVAAASVFAADGAEFSAAASGDEGADMAPVADVAVLRLCADEVIPGADMPCDRVERAEVAEPVEWDELVPPLLCAHAVPVQLAMRRHPASDPALSV